MLISHIDNNQGKCLTCLNEKYSSKVYIRLAHQGQKEIPAEALLGPIIDATR
jgi:hypothetical protein